MVVVMDVSVSVPNETIVEVVENVVNMEEIMVWVL